MSPAEFKRLYVEHYGSLYFWIRGMTKRSEAAEDIVSEAFLRAWRYRDHLRDPATAKNWVYTIAYNAFKMTLRKSRPVESLDDPDCLLHEELADPLDFTEELARNEASRRLARAARRLRTKQYAAVLRFLSGQPCQGTWGSRLNQARKHIKTALAA